MGIPTIALSENTKIQGQQLVINDYIIKANDIITLDANNGKIFTGSLPNN